MDVIELAKGQNAPLMGADHWPVHVVVAWRDASGERELDLSALLLGADHRVRSDADFVFYNQPTGAEGCVRHLGKVPTELGGEDRVHLDLAELSPDVQTVAISASLEGEDGRRLRGSAPAADRTTASAPGVAAAGSQQVQRGQ